MPGASQHWRQTTRRTVLILALAAGVSGCSVLREWLFPPRQIPQLDFERITLQRIGCLDSDCMRYKVSIAGDGTVHYEGWRGVAVTGRQLGQANPKALTTLRALLANSELYWMPSRYVPMRSNCRQWTPDEGMAIIHLRSATLDKHIVHYLGCYAAPVLLRNIENAIDAASGDAIWVYGTSSAGAAVQ